MRTFQRGIAATGRRVRMTAPIACLVSALLAAPADAQTDACADAVAATRRHVEAACSCDTASSHGAHLRCATRVADADVAAATLPPHCRGAVLQSAAMSTCGKPSAVTCCRTKANATSRCSIRRDAGHCEAPRGGTASIGTGSCRDACAPTTTTSTSTTTSSSTTTTMDLCGNGVLDPGEACDRPAFDPRCAEAPPLLGVTCVPPGQQNECLCCPAVCIIPGGGCCPGLTCVEKPGQVGSMRLGTCQAGGGSPNGAFVDG